MYFSRFDVLRRKFSSTRATCSSWVFGWCGRRPRRPSASRSASVNAVPLLSEGSRSSAAPLGNHAGIIVLPPGAFLVNMPLLLGEPRNGNAAPAREPRGGAVAV